jgi:CheY-like chemotaxis protein
MPVILLVEDEPLCARMTAGVLEAHGFLVHCASCAGEALQYFETSSAPDLVLMDIDLGGVPDGTETARMLLDRADIPLIFHSSHNEREMIERTESITSYGYVVKNSGDSILLAAIRMAFRLHELRQRETRHMQALRQSEE